MMLVTDNYCELQEKENSGGSILAYGRPRPRANSADIQYSLSGASELGVVECR
jgi:hypothetical protein